MVGVAGSGEEAIQMAMDVRPDVVVMDINMPGMDGIAAAELISQRLPTVAIIMMSVHGEAEQMRRSSRRAPGVPRQAVLERRVQRDDQARLRPRGGADATRSRRPCQPGRQPRPWIPDVEHQVIGIFSPKGGSGRTTIATNLAIAIKQQTNTRVALLDANLQFGDVGVLLNLNPKTRSIVDLADGGDPDADLVESVMIEHSTGVRALLAPPTPEGADLITPAYLRTVVGHLGRCTPTPWSWTSRPASTTTRWR